MPWVPTEPGEVPTLGWLVIDWLTEYLAAPDRPIFEPFVPYREQEEFLLGYYELDPYTCRRKVRRGVLSRPRGAGKSPLMAGIAAVEALGPVVPDGWDANGQPVGVPWLRRRTPEVRLYAVTEGQTRYTWEPLLQMLKDGSACDEYPGLEPLDTMVNLPGRGHILQAGTNAPAVKGGRTVFAVCDQTEEWTQSNGGKNLLQKVKNNAGKVGGSFIESPNAFVPGHHSVAEDTAAAAAKIAQGGAPKGIDMERFLYDHREAPADTNMWERESLTIGLRVAYGDSSGHPDGCVIHNPPCPPGHVDLDEVISVIWDPTSDVAESRSDFLNQITAASNAWLAPVEWDARRWGVEDFDPLKDLAVRLIDPREPITLGFDGSRKRARGKADATALVGCTVRDGHVFQIKVWEQPDNEEGWEVPTGEVDQQVRETFEKYNVVGFYADPAKWESYVASWNARYGAKLKVGRTTDRVSWWMLGGRIGQVATALDAFHTAVVNGEMTHDGSATLRRHVVNARRKISHGEVVIAKKHADSDDKIDAAVAAVLAWRARLDAVAKGIGRTVSSPPRRIR